MKRIPNRSKALPILFASLPLMVIALVTGLHDVSAERALDRPQTWVDGELFAGLVTLATFEPHSDSFDELYTVGMSGFLDGVPLISDAGPGDTNYNGGRWHLNVLRDLVDPAKYATASSVNELDPDDFMATDTYFECPLLPVRSRGGRR